MKNKFLSFLFILIILAGVCILSYPFVMTMINNANQSAVVSVYQAEVDSATQAERDEMMDIAQRYNKSLLGNVVITDPFDENNQINQSEGFNYDEILSIDNSGTMGYITIPAINVNLPIYHGTDDAELNLGVGHLVNSSLPIGGTTTHSILAAHTGLPDAELFTNLDKVVEGDCFYIHILGEVHEYKINQIKIVTPDVVSDLTIVPDKDYITLVTCTPYGINSHRLLVRGERTDYDLSEENYDEAVSQTNDGFYIAGIYVEYTVVFIIIGCICFAVFVFIVIVSIRSRKRRKANIKNDVSKHLKED